MKNPSTHFIFFCAFLFLLTFHSVPTTSHEVEDEREFDYVKGSGKGPENWGDIHEEWAMCKNGDMQSPIDLLHERVQLVSHLGRLRRRYKPSNATLKNRGHDIMMEWVNGAGSIYVNGTEYVLKQCHWHSPSEHTINGKSYDLEVHMVHESSNGQIAVVGIVYKIGRPDSFLSELMGYIKSVADMHEMERNVGVVNPKHLKMGSRKYYRYIGSLTTPPCTQGVVWTVVKKVRTVSREQVRLLRMAVNDNAEMNARPTQPINEREIHLYTPRLRYIDGVHY
ncbi:alpha carbonic anhydrase 7-like isoform X1 [Magnolia sinica]|uniref:alpha carbonic anhydrase 7-like isoform X1 n=1 Tax=Magnolia sinica TaxID=86752 RepID=UPI0026598D30|nr:alpha carbonic anhydrase 7-like isoform X1 [Magnolia sinica]